MALARSGLRIALLVSILAAPGAAEARGAEVADPECRESCEEDEGACISRRLPDLSDVLFKQAEVCL